MDEAVCSPSVPLISRRPSRLGATVSRTEEHFAPGRALEREMLEHNAGKYAELGALTADMRAHFGLVDGNKNEAEKAEFTASFKADLKEIYEVCKKLNMEISRALLAPRLDDIPKSEGEFDILLEVIFREAFDKKFLFIPPHRAKHYDLVLQSTITTAFPSASKEVVASGNCFACGLFTASVFHSMRAAEIGMRSLGAALDVSFPDKPLELAEWQNILDQADSKIVAMKSLQRGTSKDENLNFYSQAAVQFRYFKDAWRVRVAHARETYEEPGALKIFNHTLEFFETISTRLKEVAALAA
jgi:hypothetical protein